MGEGLTNKGIALRLDISLHTVKFHIEAIYRQDGHAGEGGPHPSERVGASRRSHPDDTMLILPLGIIRRPQRIQDCLDLARHCGVGNEIARSGILPSLLAYAKARGAIAADGADAGDRWSFRLWRRTRSIPQFPTREHSQRRTRTIETAQLGSRGRSHRLTVVVPGASAMASPASPSHWPMAVASFTAACPQGRRRRKDGLGHFSTRSTDLQIRSRC
jgi:hypothetical protein